MVNANIVLSNLQLIRLWAQSGKKEKPGINPIRCEKVEQWIDETIKLLEAQEPREITKKNGKNGKKPRTATRYVTFGLVMVHHFGY